MGVRFVSLCALLGASACVTPFSGSDVQIDFAHQNGAGHSWVPATVAYDPTAAGAPEQPEPNTYYILWAVTEKTDATGNVVENYLFDVQHFEIKNLIDPASPCFIDLEDSRFPGLHVTEFANKMEEATGVKDPLNPGCDPTTDKTCSGNVTDVLDALRRVSYLSQLSTGVQAVVDESEAAYPASETKCIEDDPNVDQSKFPPPNCTGDQSNAKRLELCRAFWTANPSFYEGSDTVFAVPLNGAVRGFVEGSNPKNGGFIGGTDFPIPTVLYADSYFVSWQFKDLNNDGMPDYLAKTPEADKPNGHTMLNGVPVHAARGVENVLLVDKVDSSYAAQMAIFPNLADDGTHF